MLHRIFLALAIVAGVTTPAAAQEMTFSLDDADGSSIEVPEEGPPSEVLAAALHKYQAEDYAAAAVQFQRVVDGGTGDGAGNQQRAQFFLAKSLYHLRFYQSALSIFDEITQVGLGHRYFDQTLRWLAQLASQLPEPAGIVERIGRYGVAQLDQFNTPESQDLYQQLVYLMGRYRYQQGEFEDAVELFGIVSEQSPYYVQAKFFTGITEVRRRRARPAVQAFREILDIIEAGEIDVDDSERMRNLAWISLARIYYTAANREDPETGERSVDGRWLGQAVEAWNQVEQGSEYWLDALFESSWAFFLADDYSRALGNIHTLNSPYFQASYYPEATVIKAVTFFVNCQIDNASATVYQFHERFDPVRSELEAVLGQYEDNIAFFDFLMAVRSGEAQLSERIEGLVGAALNDRTVTANVNYVALLDAEEERLNAMGNEFVNSPVGERILGDISLAKSFGVDAAGELARGRYNRLVNELMDLTNQIDTVDLEIQSYLRHELDAETQGQLQRASGGQGDVIVDEEHQLWPFEGEYWRDELGFYRQQVTYQCGR